VRRCKEIKRSEQSSAQEACFFTAEYVSRSNMQRKRLPYPQLDVSVVIVASSFSIAVPVPPQVI
jgi:hypothetical protein